MKALNIISDKFAPVATKFNAYKPGLAFVGGITLSILSTVEAVRSTLKAEEKILEPARAEFAAIEETIDKAVTPEAYKSARTQVYVKTALRASKLYAKPLALWGASTALYVYSYREQATRLNAATNLAAVATTALSTMHENTRQVFGDDVATALRTGEGIPEAIDNCDFDKVKTHNTKKIQYHSDAYREYADKDIDIPVEYKTCDTDHFMLSYTEETIDESYWYKSPYDRLLMLQAVEDQLNCKLTSGKVKYISVRDVREAIGYKVDDESPNDALMGWWKDGSAHPINLGLGYLWELYGVCKDGPLNNIKATMDSIKVNTSDECEREWFVILTPMGNVYHH